MKKFIISIICICSIFLAQSTEIPEGLIATILSGSNGFTVVLMNAVGIIEKELYQTRDSQINSVCLNAERTKVYFTCNDSGAFSIYSQIIETGFCEKLGTSEFTMIHGIDISDDGFFIVISASIDSEAPQLYRVTTDVGQVIKISESRNPQLHPCISPDCKNVIYSENGKITRYEFETEATEVVNSSGVNIFPSYSSCGNLIVFSRLAAAVSANVPEADNEHQLVLINAGGGNERVIHRIRQGDGTIETPCFSPNGEDIIFVGTDVYKLLACGCQIEVERITDVSASDNQQSYHDSHWE